MAEDPSPTTAGPKSVLLLCGSGKASRLAADAFKKYAERKGLQLTFSSASANPNDTELHLPHTEFDKFDLLVTLCDETFQALSLKRRRKGTFSAALCCISGHSMLRRPKYALKLISDYFFPPPRPELIA
jgi:hypothetical protein